MKKTIDIPFIFAIALFNLFCVSINLNFVDCICLSKNSKSSSVTCFLFFIFISFIIGLGSHGMKATNITRALPTIQIANNLDIYAVYISLILIAKSNPPEPLPPPSTLTLKTLDDVAGLDTV